MGEAGEEEVEQLGRTLSETLDEDEQTIGSPVYSMVQGLKPVDWSGIDTSRAKYFQNLSETWRQRVNVARKERRPGDILTLAGESRPACTASNCSGNAPALLLNCTALSRREESWRISWKWTGPISRRSVSWRWSITALVVPRRAEESLDSLVSERPGDGEAQGMLGGVCKDLWRVAWKDRRRLKSGGLPRGKTPSSPRRPSPATIERCGKT